MLKKLFFGFAAIFTLALAIVLLLASRQPDSFELKRSAVMHAQPESIFSVLNDFHHWKDWSPWEKLDPAMQKTFSGPDSGLGSIYAWEGNKNAGQGRMEITESVPYTKLVIDLEFIKPFAAKNVTEFNLQPSEESTEVTWVMRGPMPFISKIMTVFISMDKMVGKDFEQGLANMKRIVE